MQIRSRVRSHGALHEVTVATDGSARPLAVAAKADGRGSSVNGGELLMLALATCYCNDIYREAARLKIAVDSVEVEASAEFAGIGLAASDIRYRARVTSPAPVAEVEVLLSATDAVAEIHNTIRAGIPVTRVRWDAS